VSAVLAPFLLAILCRWRDSSCMTIFFDATQPVKIALVDDDQDVLHVSGLLLKNVLKAKVESFSEPEKALERLSAFKPDYFICDQRLGSETSGIDVLVKARASGFRGKVILLSGYIDSDLKKAAAAAGIDMILEKPLHTALIEKSFGDGGHHVMNKGLQTPATRETGSL